MAYGYGSGQKKRRRITKLDVQEVSVVDRPANGETFFLYKRDDTQDTPEELPFGLQRFQKSEAPSDSSNVDYDSGTVFALLSKTKSVISKIQ